MKKTTITMIGTLPPIKGMSHYCQELLQSVSKYLEVEFISFERLYPDFLYPGGTMMKGDGESRIKETKNIRVRNILTYYNPLSWIYAGAIVKGDVVHAQWWSPPLAPVYFTVLLISKIRKKRVVITVHNVIPHESSRLNNFLNNVVLVLGDEFITHTEADRKKLCEIRGIPKERIHVVPMGILTPFPMSGISKKKARANLGIPLHKKVILFFGNIRDYKGLDILIKSMRLVVKENPEAMLLIAGPVWNRWGIYERIIRDLELDRYIIKKLGFIEPSEFEFYFSSADIVVLPYKYFDAQSAVGALALPFKKPLIVTDVGGLPDFVKDKRAIAEPNNPEDLAKKINNVLRDEGLISKLKRDSERIIRKFEWDTVAKKTVQVYDI